MRTLLDITEDSVFSNRDLRNTLQHADERLDRYQILLEKIFSGEIRTEKQIRRQMSYSFFGLGYSSKSFSIKMYKKRITFSEGEKIIRGARVIKSRIEKKFPNLEFK